MPGLFGSPLFDMVGLNQSGPMNTLENLAAMRGQNASMVGSVPIGMPAALSGSPQQQEATVPMPQFSPQDMDAAMEAGTSKALRDSKKERPAKTGAPGEDDMLGFNPAVLDLAREFATEGDKNMALTRMGLGMMEAGGRTGNFLSALAAGAGQGLDTLQQQRAARAEYAMKQAEFNANQGYRREVLEGQNEQREIYRQQVEALTEQQNRLSKQYEEAEPLRKAEIALKQAQTERELAEAKARLKLAGSGPIRLAKAYDQYGNSLGMLNANDDEVRAQAKAGEIMFDAPKVIGGKDKTTLDTGSRTIGEFGGLLSDFKPEYAGYKLESVGNLANWISNIAPKLNPGAGQWWSRMQSLDNIERHQFFGAALTDNEKQLWKATTVNPGMDPKVVQQNVKRRELILERAMARKYHELKGGKYNLSQVEAMIGTPRFDADEARKSVTMKDVDEALGLNEPPPEDAAPAAPMADDPELDAILQMYPGT